jgi:hypothetical protein
MISSPTPQPAPRNPVRVFFLPPPPTRLLRRDRGSRRRVHFASDLVGLGIMAAELRCCCTDLTAGLRSCRNRGACLVGGGRGTSGTTPTLEDEKEAAVVNRWGKGPGAAAAVWAISWWTGPAVTFSRWRLCSYDGERCCYPHSYHISDSLRWSPHSRATKR